MIWYLIKNERQLKAYIKRRHVTYESNPREYPCYCQDLIGIDECTYMEFLYADDIAKMARNLKIKAQGVV